MIMIASSDIDKPGRPLGVPTDNDHPESSRLRTEPSHAPGLPAPRAMAGPRGPTGTARSRGRRRETVMIIIIMIMMPA